MKQLMLCIMVVLGVSALQASAKLTGMDTNNDNQISKEEFMSFRRKHFESKGVEFKEATHESIFDKIDKDKNGIISREEWLAK